VSVVVPAYNRERLLPRAIRSVAAQRPSPPAEIIVVDDGSTDGTAAVAERLGVRVVTQASNQGAAAARNAGMRAATQPWIALLDSDDEWLPHLLATLWQLRDGHVLVSASSLACGDDPADDRVGGVPSRRPVLVRSPAPLVFPHNFIASSGVLVRRDAIQAVGGYRTDLRYAEDFALWLGVLERGTGLTVPTVVSIYHRHGGQKSGSSDARAAQRRAIEAHRGSEWLTDGLIARRAVVDAWDDLRARRPASLSGLAAVVGTPRRLVTLVGLLAWRGLQRRRSSTVARDGGPTVALLPGGPATVSASAGPRPVVDLRRDGWLVALRRLALRPTGQAVVTSPREALMVRALGIEPLRYAGPDPEARKR
jgi:GT2 family glycosyltransferase